MWPGQPFAVIPDGTSRVIFDATKNGYQIECQPGDRRKEDPTTLERIGLDGWVSPLPRGLNVTEFTFRPGNGCQARQLGDWQVHYETHARKSLLFPKEYEGSGPLKLVSEWSPGANKSVFRVVLQTMVDTTKAAKAQASSRILHQSNDLAPDTDHHFLIHERFGTDGLLRVWRNGVLIASHDGPYGYGDRAHYRCLRIYRNARPYAARAEFRSLSVAVVGV